MSTFYFNPACTFKIVFSLRTYQSNHMEEASVWFGKELRREVEDIVVGRGPFIRDF